MDLQHIEEVEAQLAVARAELRKLEDSNKRLTGQLISFQHAAEGLVTPELLACCMCGQFVMF